MRHSLAESLERAFCGGRGVLQLANTGLLDRGPRALRSCWRRHLGAHRVALYVRIQQRRGAASGSRSWPHCSRGRSVLVQARDRIHGIRSSRGLQAPIGGGSGFFDRPIKVLILSARPQGHCKPSGPGLRRLLDGPPKRLALNGRERLAAWRIDPTGPAMSAIVALGLMGAMRIKGCIRVGGAVLALTMLVATASASAAGWSIGPRVSVARVGLGTRDVLCGLVSVGDGVRRGRVLPRLEREAGRRAARRDLERFWLDGAEHASGVRRWAQWASRAPRPRSALPSGRATTRDRRPRWRSCGMGPAGRSCAELRARAARVA